MTIEENGFVSDPDLAYPVAIHRLRRALEQAGDGIGLRLIQLGAAHQEYRLSPATEITLDETFGPITGIITPDQASQLRRLCEVTRR